MFQDLAPPTYYPGIRITDLHSTKKQVELLSGIFRIPPAKAMFLFIKPPLRVDIGINTEFKGSCQANYNLVVRLHTPIGLFYFRLLLNIYVHLIVIRVVVCRF